MSFVNLIVLRCRDVAKTRTFYECLTSSLPNIGMAMARFTPARKTRRAFCWNCTRQAKGTRSINLELDLDRRIWRPQRPQ